MAAKIRLRIVLDTIAGKRTVSQACAELGVGEAAFHKLRARALDGALSALEPAPTGRPPKQQSPAQAQVGELKRQLQELRTELRATQIREEIALTMPHLLKTPEEAAKKGDPKQAGEQRRKRRR
jgi:transposase-like protein